MTLAILLPTLTASSAATVTLDWTARPGATTYRVLAAPAVAGPYQVRATPATNHVTLPANAPQEFFYVVPAPNTNAATVTLGWNASQDVNVTGYNIYSGSASRVYTNVIAVGLANIGTVPNLTRGRTYYFAVTVVGALGLESDFSNEVNYTVPPQNLSPVIVKISLTP